MNEDQYKQELAEAGVELPEVEVPEPEPTDPTPEEPKEEVTTPEEEPTELETPKEPKKRSIYDDLKDKKTEAKTEKARADAAEKERDELAALLAAKGEATTIEERIEAQDEIDGFLSKHKEWDKGAIQELLQIARNGVKAELPEDIAKDLEEWKAWKTENSQAIEKDLFEKDFRESTPALKEIFPNATEKDFEAIKTEMDRLAHTPEFHDKELDYIAFKNKSTFEALITPRKRGMESKERKEVDGIAFDFDPNADFSKMTLKEREVWTEHYEKLMKSDGLLTDASGKKTL